MISLGYRQLLFSGVHPLCMAVRVDIGTNFAPNQKLLAAAFDFHSQWGASVV